MRAKSLWAIFTLLPGIALAAETGTLLKNDTLRKEPYADARTAGSLKRGDKVEILTKQGAWLQIKTARGSGWVRMLSVKRGETAKANEVSGLLGAVSGRSGTGQVVATTGIRGLSEEELKGAKFNEAEVKRMEYNTVSADQARQFADAGHLRAHRLEYLPKPKSAKESAQ